MKYYSPDRYNVSTLSLDMRYASDFSEQELYSLINVAVSGGVNLIYMPSYDNLDEICRILGIMSDEYKEKVSFVVEFPLDNIEDITDFTDKIDTFFSTTNLPCIDYFAFQNLDSKLWNSAIIWHKLINVTEDFLASGLIKNIGFTYKGNSDFFDTLINSYNWNFCTIDLNFIDAIGSNTIDSIKYASDNNVLVFTTSPFKENKLLRLPPNVMDCLLTNDTTSQWALNYLRNIDTIASIMFPAQPIYTSPEYMSSFILHSEGLEEYSIADIIKSVIHDTEHFTPISNNEILSAYVQMHKNYYDNPIIACNKCFYCMPCPYGLNIPKIFDIYNSSVYYGDIAALESYKALDVNASMCHHCESCISSCSAHVNITAQMQLISQFFASVEEKL